jgi:cell division protein FtsW
MSKQSKKIDYGLIISAGLILLFGFVIFTSVSMGVIANSAQKGDPNLFSLIIKQFLYGLMPGIAIAFLAYKTPLRLIKKYAPHLLFLTLILNILVFIPGLGFEVRGARRWIGFAGMSIQPAEFLKLTFILYLASWLSSKKEKAENKYFFAFLFVSLIIVILMWLQSDFSTLLVIILSGFVMYFSYRTPISHIVTLALVGGPLFTLFIVLSEYRLQRVKDLFNYIIELKDLPHQAKQALIAIGSGGLFGVGFGMGNQKYFLPIPESDSIFAAYAEEAGFIGSLLLIALFLFFSWRCFVISKQKKDSFLSLIAVGVSFWIFFQTFIHIGAMIGILPITGIPLPFISQGRSHFITELAALGVLLNISKS